LLERLVCKRKISILQQQELFTMKIKEIYIKDFRQFKDFTLDLTYPAGHAKAGEPLEKVCFIGQSGTGKTTLLNLILLIDQPSNFKRKVGTTEIINNIGFKTITSKSKECIINFQEFLDIAKPYFAEVSTVYFDSTQHIKDTFNSYDTFSFDTLKDNYEKFIAFVTDKNGNLNLKSKTIFIPANLDYDTPKEQIDLDIRSAIFDFSERNIFEIWTFLSKKIKEFQEKELQIRQDISRVAETGDITAIQEEIKKLETWKATDFNPVKDIAENCIDKLIHDFGLRVKQDLDIQQKEDIGFIKIEDFSGNEVPVSFWSTGTKQIILTAMALYLIKPQLSTILIDEPERSLYPDLQRTIINYYQGMAKDSQFFYATHSPIIASSFEPWEIVELKFDKDYKVYREKYYEGENHVDNYTIDPRFLDYDMVLKKVFDMEDTNSDMRYAALAEYKMLKNQLDAMKKENQLQTPQAKATFKKFDALAEKLALNPE
jgi:ABC-type lipoprotein export system ATPase subunit